MWDMTLPTIESPSLGTGFYTPSATPSPFMSGRSGSSSKAAGSPSAAASSQSGGTAPAAAEVSSVQSLSRTLQNSISARDMETMDSLGLLGGLSGILSEGYGSSLYS